MPLILEIISKMDYIDIICSPYHIVPSPNGSALLSMLYVLQEPRVTAGMVMAMLSRTTSGTMS